MSLWKPTCATKLGKWSLPGSFLGYLILGLFLGGCVNLYDPESSHEWHTDLVHVLQDNELASQTLLLKEASLSKLVLWASPATPPPPGARLTLTLFDLNQTPRYLLSLSQPLSDCREQRCIFTFPENQYIPGGKYAIVLESDAPVYLWGSLLDSYSQGSFSLNNQPRSADLGFSLEYRYTFQSFWLDSLNFIRNLDLLVPTVALLLTPGTLLLKLIRFPFPYDRSLSVYLILSTSLAAIPLWMAWTGFLQIRWQGGLARFLTYVIFSLLVLVSIRNRRSWLAKIHLVDLLLLLIFFLALAVRLLMSRNLVAPAWVDSVHHALITRLILENGTYPASYEPYFFSTTTSYHSGFHANLALFTWLSALPLPLAMLVFGQILNALSVYSAYAFTLAFYPNRYAGLFSATLVAFLSPMPAYYTSWGRYTHLCGLLVLPASIYLFRRNLPSDYPLSSRPSIPTLVAISVVFAGLVIIHYRVSYFALLLLGLSALEKLLRPSSQSRRVRSFHLFLEAGLIGLMVLVFSLPWLPKAWATLILPKISAWNRPPPVLETLPINLLTPALGKIVLGLAGLGLALETIRRSRGGLTLALWVVLCYATVYLSHFLSIGVGFLNMTAVTISLYLPLAALGGHGLHRLCFWVYHLPAKLKRPWVLTASLLTFILLAAFLGGRSLLPLLNPRTFLVRGDDLTAMEFIVSTTSPHQKFLIQPFLWGYGLYAGSDGGAWIPAMAQRTTIPPPVIFALSEDNAQVQRLNQISQKVLERPRDASAIAQIMRENGLQYLYLGAKGGSISPWEISQSPHFRLIYHKERVFIFELRSLQTHP
ncbi:MAG: hypothetical protein RML93_00685 [Anaerolineales bacterium]|nr:hypothetical protein [Anaerolineales bacterium]MDW8445786.1 hypothetical protein [Anaerolineales bacterium]